jgi:hypothetical protein
VTTCRCNPGHSRPWYGSQPNSPVASACNGSIAWRRWASPASAARGVAAGRWRQEYCRSSGCPCVARSPTNQPGTAGDGWVPAKTAPPHTACAATLESPAASASSAPASGARGGATRLPATPDSSPHCRCAPGRLSAPRPQTAPGASPSPPERSGCLRHRPRRPGSAGARPRPAPDQAGPGPSLPSSGISPRRARAPAGDARGCLSRSSADTTARPLAMWRGNRSSSRSLPSDRGPPSPMSPNTAARRRPSPSLAWESPSRRTPIPPRPAGPRRSSAAPAAG